MAGCGRAGGLFVPGSPGECGCGGANLYRATMERCDPNLTGCVFLRFTRRLLKYGFGSPEGLIYDSIGTEAEAWLQHSIGVCDE